MFCNRVFLQLLKHRYHFHQGYRTSGQRTGNNDSSRSTAPDLDSAIGINTTTMGSSGGIFTTVMLDQDPDIEEVTNSTDDLEASRSKTGQGDTTVMEMQEMDCERGGGVRGAEETCNYSWRAGRAVSAR
jgi:hypothetical protein